MVGQEKLAHRIRKHVKKVVPKAWAFYGASGLGKTSIARIIALSLQCDHRKFGEPCSSCRRHYNDFPIYELAANDKTGAPELREFISGANYVTLGRGKRKVYILDEAHALSTAAQRVLFKYLEDDTNVVWIVCSTDPAKLIKPLRRRLTKFFLTPLTSDQVLVYVTQLIKDWPYKAAASDLADEIVEKHIDSPGIIAQIAMNFVGGASLEEAVKAETEPEVDGLELSIAVTKGDWERVCTYLQQVPNTDARGLRASLVGLLQKQMLETTEFNKRNEILSTCLRRLSQMQFSEDLMIMGALAAELYKVTEMFSEFKR